MKKVTSYQFFWYTGLNVSTSLQFKQMIIDIYSSNQVSHCLISINQFSIFPVTMRTVPQPVQPKRKPRAVSSFLKKTYQLLNQEQNSDAARWAPNGIGFIVINEDIFSKKILPKYFKHSNYSSFVRQLNMYNFHKIRENNTESFFHHQSFDRYDEEKLVEIKRKPQKKKRKTEESDEEMQSEQEERVVVKATPMRKQKEDVKITSFQKVHETEPKIESQKNTHHAGSFEGNDEAEMANPNWKPMNVQQESQDKLSINNQISERFLPRLATRELFYPSTNNLFPFNMMAQASTFCLFF